MKSYKKSKQMLYFQISLLLILIAILLVPYFLNNSSGNIAANVPLFCGLFFIVPVSIFIIIDLVLNYVNTELQINDNSLVFTSGRFIKKTQNIQYSKISSVTMSNSLLGLLFSVRHILIYTGGDKEIILFKNADNAKEIQEVIQSKL